MKALTPADPTIPFAGIPDEDCFPVVFQNYQQSINVLNPLPSNPGNWDLELFVFPHPYIFGCIKTTDALGVVAWTAILNDGIPGVGIAGKRATFVTQAERYRLGYLGVTGFHDAAALVNNGMLAAAQYMETPAYAGVVSSVPASGSYLYRNVETWQDNPRTFPQLQNMPNSYMGSAREGVYLPFRLSQTSQQWQSASDLCIHANQYTGAALDGNPYYVLASSPGTMYPYGLTGIYSGVAGDLVNKRADTSIGHICVRQLASAASFTFFFRCGWELQVLPGTQLVPFAKTSPEYDPMAIAAYFKISREMKDAYPASFNCWGTLLSTIGGIASRVLPTLLPALTTLFKPKKESDRHPGPAQAPDSGIGVARPVPDLRSAVEIERASQRATRIKPQAKAGKRRPMRTK